MENMLIYSNLAIGGWLIFTALIGKTENLRSSIYFKVIPFFSGAILIFNGLKVLSIL